MSILVKFLNASIVCSEEIYLKFKISYLIKRSGLPKKRNMGIPGYACPLSIRASRSLVPCKVKEALKTVIVFQV